MKIMNIILFRAIFFFGILVIFPSSGYTQDKKVITSFFDKKWLKSVVSIEKMAKREGELKSTPIGSGFLIQSPNKNIVLVSTKQVVFDESQNLIEGLHFQVGKAKTINRAISNQEANKKGYGDWFISNSTDAALRLIPLGSSVDIFAIPIELMIRSDLLHPGSNTFILGFPMGLISDKYSMAIARRAMVAWVDENDILLDGLVFHGNSGSPAVYVPQTFQGAFATGGYLNAVRLIGLVTTYFPYTDVAVSSKSGRPRMIIEENSGLTKVIASDVILEIMKRKEFLEIDGRLKIESASS